VVNKAIRKPWLNSCRLDGIEGRGAHSCGAVADFHRLPEHPGDYSDVLDCSV
jgi:hypothetical protein